MIRVFPIAAPTTLTNSFAEDRGGRSHAGNDLFANEGSPLVAVDSGELRSGTDPLGGNIVNLYSDDNARYYYAHLSTFANAQGNSTHTPPAPRRVQVGDLVGFLGKTGNAAATPPHLHFEAHPNRGAAVDPYPALAAAPRVEPNSFGSRSGRSPLTLLLAAGAAGIGLWALLRPREARRAFRRLVPRS